MFQVDKANKFNRSVNLLVFYRRINETSDINQNFGERPIVEGVYVISVAARILDTHPQTLRKYERLGLVSPSRSMGMLRLYSAEDVLRVKLIKHMVDTLGLNLAGVEFALALLNRVTNLKERLSDISRDENTNELLSKKLDIIIAEMDKILPATI